VRPRQALPRLDPTPTRPGHMMWRFYALESKSWIDQCNAMPLKFTNDVLMPICRLKQCRLHPTAVTSADQKYPAECHGHYCC
jgi:hypothetical protein